MWVCIAIILTWLLAFVVTLGRSVAQGRINEHEWAANLREYAEDQARRARLRE
jgi:hypothetical protein